jgi:non-heme chloroperoxidase
MGQCRSGRNREIEVANASGSTPVVFIHGPWLLPSRWDFLGAAVQRGLLRAAHPDWPDDSGTVAEARATPDVLAKKTLK